MPENEIICPLCMEMTSEEFVGGDHCRECAEEIEDQKAIDDAEFLDSLDYVGADDA
jgi:hypothetical protein